MSGQVPCGAEEAVTRAKSVAGKGGEYFLGSGDYRPEGDRDVPWTPLKSGHEGSDCAGFAISWCYQLTRHRPGYNHGSWASVSDDINCNSALEDAQHTRELFRLLEATEPPEPGDLLMYPTFTVKDAAGTPKKFIGHVGIVIGTTRVANWSADWHAYEELDIAQCRGPNGRAPGVLLTDGSVWSHHDTVWPKKIHRSWLVRAISDGGTDSGLEMAPTEAAAKPKHKKPHKATHPPKHKAKHKRHRR